MVYESSEVNLIKLQNGSDGIAGSNGKDGKTLYTWVKYAQDSNGTGITDDPTNAVYIGILYNQESSKESNNPKDYTWTKIKGEDGTSIISVDVQYYLSSSATTLLDGSWSTIAPTWVDGKYLWSKTVTTYSNGDTSESNAACITGSKGSDGTSITILGSYTSESELKSAHPTGNLGDGYMVDGYLYVWNGSSWENVGKIQGDKGENGNGIETTTISYQASTSGTVAPTGTWSSTIPAVSEGGYLWTKVVTTYTNQNTTTSYSVARQGTNGSNGKDGVNGVGIDSIANKYAVSKDNSTVPTTWYDAVQTMTSTKRFLWNYEIITYTDGTTTETEKRIIGAYGDSGTNGTNGNGIKTITEYYLTSDKSSGITTSTSGWKTTMQTTTATNRYLWNYEIVTYTDGTTSTTTPIIIGTHGATGNGIKSTEISYQSSSSGTIIPTSTWNNNIPSVSAGQHLWTRTITTYTDNTTSISYSVARQGDNGSDGTGVSKIQEQYYLSSSSTTQTGGSWSTTSPTWKEKYYIWTRSEITWTDGTITYTTPVLANAINGANSTANTANTNASNALDKANDAITSSQEANMVLADWCYENDKTQINGGVLATGTVAAKHIAAGAITSEHISAKSITAEMFDVEDLSAIGATIGGWTIESDRLSVALSQPVLYSFGYDINAHIFSNIGSMSFNEIRLEVTGTPKTLLGQWGLAFSLQDSDGYYRSEYGINGIGVSTNSSDKIGESTRVMTFTPDNVWAIKLSTNEIVCDGTIYADSIIGNDVTTSSGASLNNKLNSAVTNSDTSNAKTVTVFVPAANYNTTSYQNRTYYIFTTPLLYTNTISYGYGAHTVPYLISNIYNAGTAYALTMSAFTMKNDMTSYATQPTVSGVSVATAGITLTLSIPKQSSIMAFNSTITIS